MHGDGGRDADVRITPLSQAETLGSFQSAGGTPSSRVLGKGEGVRGGGLEASPPQQAWAEAEVEVEVDKPLPALPNGVRFD